MEYLFLIFVLPFLDLHVVHYIWSAVSQRLNPGKSETESGVTVYTHWLGKWFSRLQYLWAAPLQIKDSYRSGRAFILPSPGKDYLHVSSAAHLKELGEAPESILSLHAFSKEMLQPKYTMDGLVVEDAMAANGSIHTRVLRVQLRSRLRQLEPELQQIIDAEIKRQFSHASNSPTSSSHVEIQSFAFTKRLFTAVNARVFFGRELCRDEGFLRMAEDFPDHLFQSAEVLQLLPHWLRPLFGPVLMRSYRASRGLVRRLVPEIESRMANNSVPAADKPVDLIQFFVDSSRSKGWEAKKIAQVLLGVWFASVHQPAITFCHTLDDLCAHPEYQDMLLGEIEKAENLGVERTSAAGLGSFIKESCRLHPSDYISVRREAIQPFTFSDGLRLEKGGVVCVPMAGILKDEQLYEQPEAFRPARFECSGSDDDKANLTELSNKFPLWGLGKHACPGRFYASFVMQLVLATIVRDYKVEFPPEQQPRQRFFSWRTAVVPKMSSSVVYTKREA